MNATPVRVFAAIAAVLLLMALQPSVVHAQGAITSGETLTGAISPAGEVDTWNFSALAGDRLILRVGETTLSSFQPQIRLYDPSNTLLATASGAAAAEISVPAGSSGTYSVLVNDLVGTVTGGYRLTLARTGVAATVTPGDSGGVMTNGTLYTGTIDVGDLDVWTVSATGGEAIVVRMGEGIGGSVLAPWLRIYNPAGALVDSSLGAAAAEVTVSAASSGPYVVVAGDGNQGLGGAGPYRLTLAKTGSAVTVTPGDSSGVMTNGAMHTGTIEIGDLDLWTVSATGGEAIVVRMGEGVSGGVLSPWLRIYSPSGSLLGSNSGSAAAEVTVSPASAGTYLVVAGDGNQGLGGAGHYRITLAETGSAVTVTPGDSSGVMTNGALHTGTIEIGDLDVWTVSANMGDAIVVRMGEGVSGGVLSPSLRIYSPSGTLLGSNSGAAAAEVTVSPASAGTYLVVAGDGNQGLGGAGHYRITLAKTGSAVTVTPGDSSGVMTNGAMHTGTIEIGDLDLWTVSANMGDAIVVRMGEGVSGSVLTPTLRIYSPSGSLLASNSGVAAAEVAITAANAGTYLVVAGDGNQDLGGAGHYRITLAKTGSPVTVSALDEGGVMTNGAMHTGTIDVGDLDLWTVSANAGDAIIVRMGEVNTSSVLAPSLRIYSPSGTLLASNSNAAAVEDSFRVVSPGTYLVVAGDGNQGLGGAGPYRLTLAKTGSPVTVSPLDQGGPLNSGFSYGFIDVGDLDVWTVTATAGGTIGITMDESVVGSSLFPWLRVYRPDGLLLASNSGVTRARISATAPTSGTYLVVAGDQTAGYFGSGAYGITPSATTDAPTQPRTFELMFAPGAPNPFATRTTFRYEIPADGPVVLRVFDAEGRLVRTLVNESSEPAGDHEVSWDGSDAAGRLVHSGLYLARLDAAGRRLVEKLTLSR